MRSIVLAAAAGLLCAVSAAQAAADAGACADALSTYDVVQCQKADLARADAALNLAYAKALAALPPEQKAKLVEAERRWVAFRDADCEAYYGGQAGTYAGVQAGACLIQHTRDRARDLATFFEP